MKTLHEGAKLGHRNMAIFKALEGKLRNVCPKLSNHRRRVRMVNHFNKDPEYKAAACPPGNLVCTTVTKYFTWNTHDSAEYV